MLFTIFCIAVWRISHLIWAEAGPFNVFGRIRGVFIKETRQYGTETRMLGELLLCMMCITMWIAMPFAWYLATNAVEFIAYTTALSGVAIFMNTAYARLK